LAGFPLFNTHTSGAAIEKADFQSISDKFITLSKQTWVVVVSPAVVVYRHLQKVTSVNSSNIICGTLSTHTNVCVT